MPVPVEAEYVDSAQFMALVEENDRRPRVADTGGGITGPEEPFIGSGGFRPSPGVLPIEEVNQ